MANDVRMYDMLISCPGDVEAAVDIIKDVIDNFNQQYMDTLGIGIRPRYWKNSGFSQSGAKPQELLNKQFVEKCDLAVAVFKTRFGTPTDKYGSGSEEEIEIMIQEGKQVFMFFDETPIENHSSIDLKQLQLVREFKEKYADKGIYWTYNSLENFRKVFDAHITRYFMTYQELENVKNTHKSSLTIKSHNRGNIVECAVVSKFDMGGFLSSERIINRIKILFERIPQYKLTNEYYGGALSMGKKVEISEATIAWIDALADRLGYDTSGEFYQLGGLRESILSSAILYGGKDLKGTEDEKKKYNDLIELREEIEKLVGYTQAEEYYSNLIGIQFIVCNEGTLYDEDIDIELHIPRRLVLLHYELQVPDKPLDLGDLTFEDIFEIKESKDFIGYSATLKKSVYIPQNAHVLPFSNTSYEEGYRDTLDEIFDYTIFEDGERLIIKVHMDYLKQHNNAAFPTWIFLREAEEYPDIEYSIISKNRPDVVKGTLKIEQRLSE